MRYLLTFLFITAALTADPSRDFYEATKLGDVSLMEAKLKQGGKLDAQFEDGFTPLIAAAGSGHKDAVIFLIKKGASIDKKSRNGFTPLYAAARFNQMDCAKILLESGASINEADIDGITPLMTASSQGHKEMVSLLLANDADTSLKSKNGLDAFDFAHNKERKDVMKMLDAERSVINDIPLSEALILADFRDSNGVRDPGIRCTISHAGSSFSKTGITDSRGRFILSAPKGKKYDVKCDKFGQNIQFAGGLDIPKSDVQETIDLSLIVIVEQKYTKTIPLKNLNFDSGKHNLKSDAPEILDPVVSEMLKKPNMIIEVAGHTDNLGNKDSNMELSRRRAESVRKYFIDKGVQSERILAKGYGPVKPIASNSNEAGRKQNRRIEIKVIKE